MQKCRTKRGIRIFPIERTRCPDAAYLLMDQLIALLDLEGVEYRRYQQNNQFVLELNGKPSWAAAQLLAQIVGAPCS